MGLEQEISALRELGDFDRVPGERRLDQRPKRKPKRVSLYGTCVVCCKDIRIKKDGKLWKHYRYASGPICDGTGCYPSKVYGELCPNPE